MAYDDEEKTDNRMTRRYQPKGIRAGNTFNSAGYHKRSKNKGRGLNAGAIARKPSSVKKELEMREAEWLAKMTALLTPSGHALMPGGQTSYNPSQGMPGWNPSGGPPLLGNPLLNMPQPNKKRRRGWWGEMA